MNIRQATNNDIDSIIELQMINAKYHASLVVEGKLKPTTESFFINQTNESLHDNRKKVIIGVEDQTIIGYAIGWLQNDHPIFDFGNQGLIDDIFIHSDYQRLGYGNMLVENLFEWFKENNISRVELNVYGNNSKGVDFWNKQGFHSSFNRMVKEIR